MPIKTMMSLIRNTVFGQELPFSPEGLTAEKLEYLYHLSKKHDMVHLVGASLMTVVSDLPDCDTLSKFRKQYMLATLRYENLTLIFDTLSTLFEEEKIPYIPLKGSLLRRYYPEPWMRTSCDIDILIHQEDLERAEAAILEKLHYTKSLSTEHDISFSAPNGIHFELHYTLIEDKYLEKADVPLTDVWSDARPAAEGSCRYLLSDEMFYYYHIAHMAKHFVEGGCGIRPVLDLAILRKALILKDDVTQALLEDGGLLTFAEGAETLCDVWFFDQAHTELTATMERFLLSGGTYGHIQNAIAMKQTRKGKGCYLLSRIFMPYASLCTLYPSLKKHRLLTPFYQVRRWFGLMRPSRRKRIAQELKYSKDTTDDTLSATSAMLKDLNLQ